jgi:hypothetical protein
VVVAGSVQARRVPFGQFERNALRDLELCHFTARAVGAAMHYERATVVRSAPTQCTTTKRAASIGRAPWLSTAASS